MIETDIQIDERFQNDIDAMLIERAMRNLPDRFRELLALRELEGLSYREMADAMSIPMGTVMSSLSRARHAFRDALDNELKPSRNAARTTFEKRRQTKGNETSSTEPWVNGERLEATALHAIANFGNGGR